MTSGSRTAWTRAGRPALFVLALMAAHSLTSAHAQSAPASAPSATPSTAPNGRVLAANCANCHGTNGQSKGAIPSLAGQKSAYIVEQMQAFKQGKRQATIMHQLAKGYTDAEIEAMADYFSKQKPN